MSGTLCEWTSPKLGRGGLCTDKSFYGKPTIAYFVKSTFVPSYTTFLLEATYTAAVKAETVFPVKFDHLEWADVEAGVWTSGTGIKYKTTARKHIAIMKINSSLCLKSEMIKLNNFKGGVMIGYDQQYLRGCSITDDVVIGMRLDKVIFMGEEQQGTNSEDPSMLIFHLIFTTDKDFIDYEYTREMTAWIPSELDGIHNAVLTKISSGILSASIVISVHIDCDGSYVPVEGLVTADLVSTMGTIGTTTESTETAGNYTLTPSTTWVTGTINLVGTSALTYSTMALQSTGALSITISE
jgi:hypothetical protein